MFSENVWILVIVFAGSVAVKGKEITYAEHALFPKLYHLDDYNDCLGPTDGLYCVGSFHIRSLKDRDPLYELMHEYSLDIRNFNRTLLHRGYCLSSRCPSLSHVRNASLRFERCAAHYAKRRSLRTMLIELNYCRTHAQEYASTSASIETPHLVFLFVIFAILVMNIIGTTYDVMKGDDKKSELLTSWSMVSNWAQIVSPYPDGDPRLKAILPVDVGRGILIFLVILAHAGLIHVNFYLANPKFIEDMSHHWVLAIMQNGTSVIQFFFVLSSFLMAQSLINIKQLTFIVLLKLIVKRIFRILPVYLLGIGFAATWWPFFKNGPLWHAMTIDETQVCREKFWYHVFFLQNIVEPHRYCQVQTWFLAVDMQLYIVGCILMMCLSKVRRLVLPLLGIAFVTTVLAISYLAYINQWRPMIFVVLPENMRQMFKNDRSFIEYYISPLGSIHAVLVGVFLAHLHHRLYEAGFNFVEHKYLMAACQLIIPLLPLWAVSSYFLRDFTSKEFQLLYITIERPIATLMVTFLLFGAFHVSKKNMKKVTSVETSNGHGPHKPKTEPIAILKHMISWRIWYPLGRISLSVLVLHWPINMLIKAPTLQPISSSVLDMFADTLATACLTYLLAIPVTLCVQIPFMKSYSALTS